MHQLCFLLLRTSLSAAVLEKVLYKEVALLLSWAVPGDVGELPLWPL